MQQDLNGNLHVKKNPHDQALEGHNSQNHGMVGIGRDLCGSSSPTPQLLWSRYQFPSVLTHGGRPTLQQVALQQRAQPARTGAMGRRGPKSLGVIAFFLVVLPCRDPHLLQLQRCRSRNAPGVGLEGRAQAETPRTLLARSPSLLSGACDTNTLPRGACSHLALHSITTGAWRLNQVC